MLEQYLEVVPIPVLIAAPALAGLVFLLCPARLRLPAALVILPPFLIIGRLPLLGTVALGAKALGFAMLLALGVAAMLSPGPKRRLHPLCYAYVPLAFAAPFFIVTTEDPAIPILYGVQWICLVFAAIMLCRTIVDADSLFHLVKLLGYGFLLATPILLSALVTGQWSYTGHSRFEPYGASAVQTSIVFTMTAGLGAYLAFRDNTKIMRPIWIGMVAAATGMALLTGTRSAMITLIGVCAPVGFYAIRKPVLAVPALGVVIIGIAVVLSRVDSNPFDRYKTLETARGEQAVEYIQESIAQRPLTGLLGTRGFNAQVDESLGFHAHNAYLKMAYTGGLVMLVPYLMLAGITLLCAVYVFRNRRLFDTDPLLTSVLVAFMFMIYAQGMVNHMIYQATHTWALLHVLLSMLFITQAGEVVKYKREFPALAAMQLKGHRLAAQ